MKAYTYEKITIYNNDPYKNLFAYITKQALLDTTREIGYRSLSREEKREAAIWIQPIKHLFKKYSIKNIETIPSKYKKELTEKIKALSAKNHNAFQIAALLHLSPRYVRLIKKDNNIQGGKKYLTMYKKMRILIRIKTEVDNKKIGILETVSGSIVGKLRNKMLRGEVL